MADLWQAFLTLLSELLWLLGQSGLLFVNALPWLWALTAVFFLVVFLVRR